MKTQHYTTLCNAMLCYTILYDLYYTITYHTIPYYTILYGTWAGRKIRRSERGRGGHTDVLREQLRGAAPWLAVPRAQRDTGGRRGDPSRPRCPWYLSPGVPPKSKVLNVKGPPRGANDKGTLPKGHLCACPKKNEACGCGQTKDDASRFGRSPDRDSGGSDRESGQILTWWAGRNLETSGFRQLLLFVFPKLRPRTLS